ncbi:MAG: PAS domain S-box protein [Chloroflexota bacterium]
MESSSLHGSQEEQPDNTFEQNMAAADASSSFDPEDVSDAYYALDRQWRFTQINSRAERLMRQPRVDLLGKSIWDVLPGAIDTAFYAEHQMAVRTGTPGRFEAFYPAAGIWIEAFAYPSQDGLSVFFQDTTTRKQAVDALRESEQRFRAVWETSADAMVLSDRHGTVLNVNPAYIELYGYTFDELVGKNFAIIFPDERRAEANEDYQRAFNSQGPFLPFERTVRHKGGTERVVEARIDFIEERGERVAMLSSIRDVTNRNRAAEALKESEERFRKTFDEAPIGMALVGTDLKPTRVNQALGNFLGYSEAELLSMSVADLTYPEDVEADIELAKRLLRGEIPDYKTEKRYVTKAGEMVWAQLLVTVIRDNSGNVMSGLSMLEDITSRKAAEGERAQLLAREHEARLLAEGAVRAEEELLSMVSHDLRNPVAVISGITQLLQKQIARGNQPTPERLNSELAQLAAAASRMKAFIRDLSTPQHLEPGQMLLMEPERVDLVALCRRVIATHARRTERHQLTVEADLPQLVGYWDPVRLEQVLDNLISNAVKYSPAGGTVLISIGYEEPTAEGGDISHNRRAVLHVKDEGIGIPSGDLPHVFEWYRRASNARDIIGGTGIGLASARQIIEQHGGRIIAESHEGVGSIFTVLLPLNYPAVRTTRVHHR